MAERRDHAGPYTVWVDYGYEGWAPTSFDTLSEAIAFETYSSRKTITRPVQYEVKEVAPEGEDHDGR